MAKKTISARSRLLNNRIKKLKQRIENQTIYLDIYKETLDERRNRKLKQLKDRHENILHDYEVQTLDQKAYLELFSKADLLKLDNWYKLKQREINHRFKEDHNKLNEKLDKTKEAYVSKKKSIIEKYTIPERSENELSAAKDLYLNQIEYLNKGYEALAEKLGAIDESQFKERKQKIDKDIRKIENELVELRQKKVESAKADQNYELSEDVALRLENLRMEFGGLVAVSDLTFDVKKGEIFGLIGPNGAGKTTVFNCITQFYKANKGTIIYRDKNNDVINLNDYKVHDVIDHGIVRTFQNVELIWELSILDNLLVAAHKLYQTGFFGHLLHTRRFKREEAILKAKAIKVLTDLGLLAYKDFFPIGLPYGILKQIELARTLMTNPNLIILDEPAAGLNDQETDKLIETIRKIQKEYDATIFLVEHDMGLVMELCDTICAISFGKKLAIGTPKEIQSNKLVQEAYLGGE